MAYNVKFVQGSSAKYNALVQSAQVEKNTFYYIDDANLYLGTIKLSDGPELAAAVERIVGLETVVGKEATGNEDATGIIKEIADIKKELGALVGDESGGSITEMISDAISKLDTDLKVLIKANADAIAQEAVDRAAADSALEQSIGGVAEDLAELAQTVADNETDIEAKHTAMDGRVSDVEGDIASLINRVGVVEGDLNTAETGLKARMTAAEGDIDDLESLVSTLVGEDADKSARVIASEEVAKIVANADTDFDTLKEIADWILAHPDSVADLNSKILANENAIKAINHETDGILAQAKAHTDAEIDKVELAIDAINDGTNGILAQAKAHTNTEVKKVSDALDAYKESNNAALGDVSTVANRADAQAATNKTDIANLTTTVGNNATAAQNALDQAIADLKTAYKFDDLKSAAYKEASYFENDAQTKANTAKQEAMNYVDAALTWTSMA